MEKKTKIRNVLRVLAVILLLLAIYFGINQLNIDKYEVEFNGYSKYYAGDNLVIKVNINKYNKNSDDYYYNYSSAKTRVSKGFKVELLDFDGKKVKNFKYTGKTFDDKDTEVQVELPEKMEPGKYELKVKTTSLFIKKGDYAYITIEKSANKNMVISLDKGIYKPGDDILYRVMILSKNDQTPIENDDVKVNIYDGNDNKVYSVDGKSTEYGIVAGKFSLADEVNSGNYKIIVECGSQKEEKNFTVNPYVTPQFETTISTDKEVYNIGEIANISFDAKYFFGEPVVGAKIEYFINGEKREGLTDESGHFATTYDAKVNGQVNISCEVVDSSNYLTEASKSYIVSNKLINIELIPEYGKIVRGVDNNIYVFAKDATGKPIKTYNSIKIGNIKRDVITDEKGVSTLLLTKNDISNMDISSNYKNNFSSGTRSSSYSDYYEDYDYDYDYSYNKQYDTSEGYISIDITSKDMNSNEVSNTIDFPVMKTGSKIVSTNKVIFDQGDDIYVGIKNSDLDTDNTLYVMKNNTLIKVVSFDSSETTLNLGDVSGIVDIYEEGLNNKRTIFIRPTKALKIDIDGEDGEFRPGDKLNLKLTTADNDGEKADSNLLISILDNAVLNLAENDLSIDNIKLALEDLTLVDGVSAADVYASAIESESPELLLETLVKQETEKPYLINSNTDYGMRDFLEIGFVISVVSLIVAIVTLLIIRFADKCGGIRNIFITFFNIVGLIILSNLVIWTILMHIDNYYYINEKSIYAAAIAIGIAIYILFGKKHKEFLFDNVYKLIIVPSMVFIPNAILITLIYGDVLSKIWYSIIIGEIVLYTLAMVILKKTKREKGFQIMKYFALSTICAFIFYAILSYVMSEVRYRYELMAATISVFVFMILNFIIFGKKFSKGKGSRIEDGKLIIDINGNAIIAFMVMIFVILMIAIGVYIYTSAQAQVTNSITNMSTAVPDEDYDRPSNKRITYDDISPDSAIRDGASDDTGTAASGIGSLFSSSKSKNDNYEYDIEDAVIDEEVFDNEYESDDIDVQTTSQDKGVTGKVEKVRSVFLESLAFIPDLVTKNGEVDKEIQLSDNITTWNIQVVGNSKKGDVGYTTSEFKVFKEFFINYTLPTNAVVTDKVKIPVTIYNYTENDMTVNINIPNIDWGNIGEYKHDVNVPANNTAMIYVPIEILKAGKNALRIESKAGNVSDIVEKTCNVKLNGVERTEVVSSGTITEDYHQDIIFDDEAIGESKKIKVKIYPSDISAAIENIENMLKMPTGCFEQTSSSLYPDILVLKYLENNGIDDTEIRDKALGYISKGYQKLLTYEVSGTKGGYSLYGSSPAEPVITAFGLMEMKEASEVYEVDDKVIDNMKEYLFNVQKSDGSFNIGSTYIGGSTSTSNLAMNAYIIWGLSETYPEDSRINKSVEYLEKHMNDTQDTYTLALMANVFSNTKNKNADKILERIIKTAQSYENFKCIEANSYDYYGTRGVYQNVQTTALTIMALCKEDKEKILVQDLVNYIVSRKDSYGTWGTTQSTILALKSINSATDKGKNSNQTIKVKLNDETKEIKVDKNVLSMYEIEFNGTGVENKLNLDIEKGKISYEVVKEYYETYENAMTKNTEELVANSIINPTEGKVNDEIIQTIHIENLGENISNGLVKINIPQGCSVIEESLSKLKAQGQIEKYEYNYNTINLYIRNFDKNEFADLEVGYRANYPVEITGGIVKVYDYYNPEVSTITEPISMLIVE